MNAPNFRLLPTLQLTPHFTGGRRWYAVEDPQSGRFLKLGAAEYLVASGLQNGVAMPQIVEVLTEHGFSEPRDRVTATVTWLAKQGLLINESTAPSESKEATGGARPVKPLTPSKTFDPFFIRLPLLSGSLTERLARPLTWLISLPAAIGFVLLLIVALTCVFTSTQRLWSLNEKLFVEDGRLWWLVAWFVLKCVHELGHAVAAVSTGSRIRSAGIHLIFMAPVPYVDVTELWRVTNRRQRVLVSSAGMLAEIALASIAILLALYTSSLQLQYMCAAVATLGTITTIAFNGNPLMKFDGYYILSDYLSRPNLWTEAQAAANATIKRLINPFAGRSAPSLSASGLDHHTGQLSLAMFGLTTMFYRVLMLVSMACWLLVVWHGIGVAVIAWAVWGWFVRPYWTRRAARQAAVAAGLMPPPSANVTSFRARALYTGALAALACLIGVLPAPLGVRAPGIVGYGEPVFVRTAADGVLTKIYVSDRQVVSQGELIATLENTSLLVELEDARLKHAASQEAANALRARGELALLQAEQAKLESLASHIEQLTDRAANLELRAPTSGQLFMSLADKVEGRFMKQGSPLCMIVQPNELEVTASASQRDAALFVQHLESNVSVAQTGGAARPGRLISVDSRGSEHCDQQPLAARYGGPLAVEAGSNAQGEAELKYPTPRFVVKAQLTERDSGLIPGQLVWVHLNERPVRIWQLAWETFRETIAGRMGQQ